MVRIFYLKAFASVANQNAEILVACTDGCVSEGETSAELRGVTGSTTDSDESHHNPLTMSTMSTRNNSLTASMYSHHIMTRSLPTIEGSFLSQSLRKFAKAPVALCCHYD